MIALSGFFVAVPAFAASAGDVVINEFSSDSSPEWVELRNTTASPINLSGWTIKDLANPAKSLSGLGTIPANGIVVFEESSVWLNNTPTTETITIFDNSSNPIDSVSYGSDIGVDVVAPLFSQSAVFDGTNWAISTVPTKGYLASIATADPATVDPLFTPEIGATLSLNSDAYIGRTTTYTGSPLGTPTDIFWRVTVSGPSALTDASIIDLDEVGFNDPGGDGTATSTFHYPLKVVGNDLVTTGSCDLSVEDGETHSNVCDTLVGFSLDTNDEFTNADKIKFNSNAPTGAYTITYDLVNTNGGAVVGTFTQNVTVAGTSVIATADPATVDPLFTPEIGATLSLNSDAYIGRTTTYSGSATGTPNDTIKWRVTIDGPAALTADMVDLDEVGFNDPGGAGKVLGTYHYPFAVDGENLVKTGSCDDVDDHDGTCDQLIGFSLDTNDNFTNADKIKFNSNAPTGSYTIKYELVNTNGGAVVGTFTQNVTVVHTSGDIAPSSSIVGQADLSSATLTLTDATVLDLSSSKTSQSSSDVTVGGNIVTLTQQVVLQSGVDTQPIVLTNSNLAGVSVSIPDGTKVQGPAGWDGTIQPPKTGSNAGTAPSGFSVGSTVISVGSPGAVLVFDTPVTLTLTGVTGAVGYKPAGSDTWVQITNTCAGDYGAPTPPTAPGECKISNGTDTKIVTFHFTEFGELDPIPASVSSSGRTGSRAGDFARSSVTGVGQVLGAFTETERQAQIATIRTSLISLIQQLIGLLQAQLAAAITAGNQ